MARRIRIQAGGAFYHIVSRGNRAESIFADDVDRARFLETLAGGCEKTGWHVLAFVLMPNHFHLLIRTPQANLVQGMKWILGTYTVRYNARHRLRGHLFSGRYRSQLVSSAPVFIQAVADYIHLNPARARLLALGQPLRDYRWSSLPYLLQPESPPKWYDRGRLLGLGDGGALEARLECMRTEPEAQSFKSIRHDWCFGEEEFRSAMLEKVAAGAGRNHIGEELAAVATANAETLVTTALVNLNWTERELASRPKGDAQKLRLAQRLRAESTMTLKWIAARLSMGTPGHLSHLLYWMRRGVKPPKAESSVNRRPPVPSKARQELNTPALDVQEPPPSTASFSFDTSFD